MLNYQRVQHVTMIIQAPAKVVSVCTVFKLASKQCLAEVVYFRLPTTRMQCFDDLFYLLTDFP